MKRAVAQAFQPVRAVRFFGAARKGCATIQKSLWVMTNSPAVREGDRGRKKLLATSINGLPPRLAISLTSFSAHVNETD
jgi:hypothetical protein